MPGSSARAPTVHMHSMSTCNALHTTHVPNSALPSSAEARARASRACRSAWDWHLQRLQLASSARHRAQVFDPRRAAASVRGVSAPRASRARRISGDAMLAACVIKTVEHAHPVDKRRVPYMNLAERDSDASPTSPTTPRARAPTASRRRTASCASAGSTTTRTSSASRSTGTWVR